MPFLVKGWMSTLMVPPLSCAAPAGAATTKATSAAAAAGRPIRALRVRDCTISPLRRVHYPSKQGNRAGATRDVCFNAPMFRPGGLLALVLLLLFAPSADAAITGLSAKPNPVRYGSLTTISGKATRGQPVELEAK